MRRKVELFCCGDPARRGSAGPCFTYSVDRRCLFALIFYSCVLVAVDGYRTAARCGLEKKKTWVPASTHGSLRTVHAEMTILCFPKCHKALSV